MVIYREFASTGVREIRVANGTCSRDFSPFEMDGVGDLQLIGLFMRDLGPVQEERFDAGRGRDELVLGRFDADRQYKQLRAMSWRGRRHVKSGFFSQMLGDELGRRVLCRPIGEVCVSRWSKRFNAQAPPHRYSCGNTRKRLDGFAHLWRYEFIGRAPNLMVCQLVDPKNRSLAGSGQKRGGADTPLCGNNSIAVVDETGKKF